MRASFDATRTGMQNLAHVFLRARASTVTNPDDASTAARMRALAQLARPTAHELRGALSSMTMHLELLAGVLDEQHEPDTLARRERYFAVLRQECGRMQRVADAFLGLAAPLDGPGEVDLAALVAGVIDAVRPFALGRGVRLELAGCAPLVRQVPDREPSRQRLLDAALEAIAAAQAGAVIRIHVIPAEQCVRLEVGDGAPLDVPLFVSTESSDG